MRVKASNGAFDGFKAAPDLRAAMAMPPAAHGAGAGKVMINLTPHGRGLADDSFRQIR